MNEDNMLLYKPKNQPIIIQPSNIFEEVFMRKLDDNKEVESWRYEKLQLHENGKIYVPDFHITYKNGNEEIVEIKDRDEGNFAYTRRKLKAMERCCKKLNMPFRVVYNDEV
jgi:TnsA endonuclease N terminal.